MVTFKDLYRRRATNQWW